MDINSGTFVEYPNGCIPNSNPNTAEIQKFSQPVLLEDICACIENPLDRTDKLTHVQQFR